MDEFAVVPAAGHVARAFGREAAGWADPPAEPVLINMQTAGMNALSLAPQPVADPRTRDITDVAFTAHAKRGDEARLLATGCDGHLSKPIDVARLADQVLSFAAAGRGHGHG